MAALVHNYAFRRRRRDSYDEWAKIKDVSDMKFLKWDSSRIEPPNGFSPVDREVNRYSNYDPRTWPKTEYNCLDTFQKGQVNEIFMLTSKEDFDGLCYFERPIPSSSYKHMKAHDYLATQVQRRAWEKFGGPAGLKQAKVMRDEIRQQPRRTTLSFRAQAAVVTPPRVLPLVKDQPVLRTPIKQSQETPFPSSASQRVSSRIESSTPPSRTSVQAHSGLTPSIHRLIIENNSGKSVEGGRLGSSQPTHTSHRSSNDDPFVGGLTPTVKSEVNDYEISSLPRRRKLDSGNDSDEDLKKPSLSYLKRSESTSPMKRQKVAAEVKKERI